MQQNSIDTKVSTHYPHTVKGERFNKHHVFTKIIKDTKAQSLILLSNRKI